MGGCRCTFRKCANNTANSPGMHFFHYPLKYPDRFKEWTKFADREEFIEMDKSKSRNKVVCETHFRDECFMNYKKDRLVHFAKPTLVRLKDGLVLDYEESDDPTPKVLEPTSHEHLIPKNVTVNGVSPVPQKQIKRTYPSTSGTESPVRIFEVKKKYPPKLLNSSVKQFWKSKTTECSVNTLLKDVGEKDEITQIYCDEFCIEPVEEEIGDGSVDIYMTAEDSENYIQEEEIELHEEEIKGEKGDDVQYDEMVAAYEEKLKNLKQELEQQRMTAANTQVETVTTSRKSATTSSGTLTKAQLYNAIKKYLSPSMAAIVRMEMFGGPERSWKPDEKQIAIELLKLGDNVFDYCRDEWRFRLPSKKEVEQWVAAFESPEDDEDL